MQKKLQNNMEEMIDFQNLTQIKMSNQSLMEEVEMKKLLNTLAEEAKPRFLSSR